MVDTTSPRLRARHDAGRPPYLLRRLLVLVGSLGVTTGLTVTGAGLLRYGPLAWLGWSEQVLTPQQVLVTGPAASAVELKVAVRWNRPLFCPDTLHVEADQGAGAQVVIHRVTSKVPRLAFLGPDCVEQRASQGRAFAILPLKRSLSDRRVVDDTGRRLDVAPG